MGELGSTMRDISAEPMAFDRDRSRLSIGDRSTVVPDSAAGNEAMLRSYLALVAEVRGTPIGSGIEVRHDDVVVLAEILDLADADLEVHLANLLGVSAKDAADVHRRIRWHHALVAAATLTFGGLTYATSGGSSAAASPAVVAASPAAATWSAATPIVHVTVTEPAESDPAAAEAPSDAPPPPSSHSFQTPSDDVQIGDALVIERGEQPVDPETQIGDAVTYER